MSDENEFAFNGVSYVAEDSPIAGGLCVGCVFRDDDGCGCVSPDNKPYACTSAMRTDKRNVIWKRQAFSKVFA